MTPAREYIGPIRPRRGARWDKLCGTDADAGRSEEWRAGFNHAVQTLALWLDFQVSCLAPEVVPRLRVGPGVSSVGMLKSNLLGRLMRGEDIRRRPCPVHQGRLSPLSAPACCDGTGWLRNTDVRPPDDESSRVDHMVRGINHWFMHPRPESMWRELPPGGMTETEPRA